MPFVLTYLFFSSFSISGIQKIEDTCIWDDSTNFFKSSTEIFNSLYDRRNWISEYSRIKMLCKSLNCSCLAFLLARFE
jgi:hypothetical protein